ncbi:MAG: DTW domain-containing protein [Sandaracinaceae bacterium]|nr:MAG: DTW domain-containing protein [Sandaracinaceae bacterium]
MGRQRTQPRCARCRLLDTDCVCALLWPVASRTRVVLVPHVREWRQPSNTGRLAVLGLWNSELAVWGRRAPRLDPSLLLREGETHLLLHPSEGARPIEPIEGRVRLLVPDGSWRRAGRIARRLAALPGVQPVRVDVGPHARLRRAPSPDKVHTAAAIAAALEALGDVDAAAALRASSAAMIARQLSARSSTP